MASLTALSGRVLDLEKQVLANPSITDFNNMSQINSSRFNTLDAIDASFGERITDIEAYITSLKLAQDALTGHQEFSTLVGNAFQTSINVTHNLDSKNLNFSLRDTTSEEFVGTTITAVDNNVVTLQFASAPSSGQYEIKVST